MAPDELDRVYGALMRIEERQGDQGAQLANLQAAVKNLPTRPCAELAELRLEHRDLNRRVGAHLKTQTETTRHWQGMAFEIATRVLTAGLVATLTWIVARAV